MRFQKQLNMWCTGEIKFIVFERHVLEKLELYKRFACRLIKKVSVGVMLACKDLLTCILGSRAVCGREIQLGSIGSCFRYKSWQWCSFSCSSL